MDTTTERTMTHESTGQTRIAAFGDRGWVLRVAHHPDPRFFWRSYSMLIGTGTSLGRRSAELGEGALSDVEISRVHVQLEASQEHLLLTCTGKNGVSVNGNPCPRLERMALSDGHVLSIPTSKGAILLVVRFTHVDHAPREHPGIIGRSSEVALLLHEIDAIARRTTPVLIRGPSGSGKDLAARAIHEASGRRGHAFQSINCAELMEETFHSELYGHKKGAFTGATGDRVGLADVADGGTLFLNEIAEASARVQARLLSFLDDKQVRPLGGDLSRPLDLRIICASNAAFEDLVGSGRFRHDLYFRITGDTLQVPALADRMDDVPVLAEHFVRLFDPWKRRLDHRIMSALLCHPWPGNVRELRQVVSCAVAFAGDSETIGLSERLAALLASSARIRTDPGPAQVFQASSDGELSRPGAALPENPWSRPDRIEMRELRGALRAPGRGGHEAPAPEPSRRARADRAVPSPEDLRALLVRCEGRVARMAAELGVPRPTLYHWLQGAGVDLSECRGLGTGSQ